MDDRWFQLRDPSKLLTDVMHDHPFVVGDLLVVLIELPSTLQRVVDVRRIKRRDWEKLDQRELSDLLCDLARDMPVPPREPGVGLTHDLHTILCRPGFTVVDGEDARVLAGWRYSNHITNALDGGLTLVTEHGWYDLMTDTAGHEPSLPSQAQSVLRAV